ncbi:hypothetical protein BRD06_10505 [Halobacteriales archaeon QS_9_67_15]|nr:MAG: hypothetical protein BRD06_10505 [Halobacteriales archaeon QS_9_67_15]
MVERSERGDEGGPGGEPEAIGQCTECGEVYAVQHEDGDLRPIGTDGVCECGNDVFESVTEL